MVFLEIHAGSGARSDQLIDITQKGISWQQFWKREVIFIVLLLPLPCPAVVILLIALLATTAPCMREEDDLRFFVHRYVTIFVS